MHLRRLAILLAMTKINHIIYSPPWYLLLWTLWGTGSRKVLVHYMYKVVRINHFVCPCSVSRIVEEFRQKSKLQLRCFNVTVNLNEDDNEAV